MNYCEGFQGEKIAFHDQGDSNKPILFFVHGFSQSSLCWKKQFTSKLLNNFRLVSVDIRGHGASDKPQFKEAYNNYLPFAYDLNAVINNLGSSEIIPVCWSMGGNWICDYLREFGEGKFRGIVLVSATTQQGTSVTENFFGKGAIENLSNLFDPENKININATKSFVRACISGEYKQKDFEEILCYNMMVSPKIRRWILDRVSDNAGIIEKLSIPILQIHGLDDKIVLPFASEYTMSKVKHHRKELKLYKNIGHSPFYEDYEKFNNDLNNFAKKVLI